MAKIVYAPLTKRDGDRSTRRSAGSWQMKTVTAPDGSKIKIVSVDADSPTFSQDLTSAFKRNVARLRRENRHLKEQA